MRVYEASAHNRIANHPSVRPSFAWAEGELSFDACAADPDTYALLVCGDAAAIYEWSAPGVWQAHSMALPGVRGREVIAAGKRMNAWMRDHLKARMIWGHTPVGNRAARLFNRLIGARSAGFRDHHVTGLGELFVVEFG